MKESITKFDLEAAFKALDELDIPTADKIKANKPALNEIFSRKSKFDALFEEYYDISSTDDLSDAQESREAEIAKAKLARIEKIVDLDAESPEDLLTSYVGKYIMQCPQCMTLFYKDKEDIEESEEDATTVNVSEVCQHCGNDSGYTLIGKVGEAEPEDTAETEMELTDADSAEDQTDDTFEDSDENSGETDDTTASTEESDELDDIDLDIVDDEVEESFTNNMYGDYLVEQLTEDADDANDLDISDAEFSELLNSPEFSKPISYKSTSAMLDKMSESVIEQQNDEADSDELTEGSLGLLGKTLKKKFGQVSQNIKDKASAAIDKFADNTMDREEKANWVLKNTLKPDVREVEIDNEGKVIIDEKDQRFDTFTVIGYKGHYSNGRPITMSPTKTNKDLIVGMSEPEFRDSYGAAEQLAKGWSMEQKGGPAFIYLTKGKSASEGAYLCQFFQGKLDAAQDQLENYFAKAKKDLEGKAHIAKGGGVGNGNSEVKTEERAASTLKAGNKIVMGDDTATVEAVGNSKFQAGSLAVKLKGSDGNTETLTFNGDAKVSVIVESFKANKALKLAMENINEIDETRLESLISKSLIEAYKNVAGFRISNCEYLNEKFIINGKIFFESGNVRNTSYVFTEALNAENKITFRGLNEKLGDRCFSLSGKADNNKFIIEAFNQYKN